MYTSNWEGSLTSVRTPNPSKRRRCARIGHVLDASIHVDPQRSEPPSPATAEALIFPWSLHLFSSSTTNAIDLSMNGSMGVDGAVFHTRELVPDKLGSYPSNDHVGMRERGLGFPLEWSVSISRLVR
jgi:hypothetical protein